MPTTIVRAADSGSQAGAATMITATWLGLSRLATAVRTADGRLKVISWFAGATSVDRAQDSGDQAGAVSELAMTTIGPIVTAVRTSAGRLKLIAWDTGAALSDMQRVADSGDQAGEASRLTIQRVGPTQSNANLVTAVRTAAGTLKLISWRYPGAGQQIIRLGDSGNQAGEVSRIALAVDGARVITAVRTAAGTLKLISWRISPDGTSITRMGDSGNQAGAVSEISLAASSLSPLVTAVRTASGRLKLITWRISSDLATIERLGDSGDQAGEASEIAVARVVDNTTYLAAVRTAAGTLKLVSFDVSAGGASVTRTGDSGNQAGAVSEIALDATPIGAPVTAVRDAAGRLKLISWTVTP